LSQTLSRTDLLKLARAGAEARVDQLQQELAAIYSSFPDLRSRRGPVPATSAHLTAQRKPGVRGWTAAQRKAAADRMKKYWASRKGKK
jgi:hypothetical protein